MKIIKIAYITPTVEGYTPKANQSPPPRVTLPTNYAHTIFRGLLDLSYFDNSISTWQLLTKLAMITPYRMQEYSKEHQQGRTWGDPAYAVMSEAYLKKKLQEIEALANWATDNGYSTIKVF
jgi:hypothetical protein